MNIRFIHYWLVAIVATMIFTSCDEHLEEDFSWRSWQPGMVYCTNGEVSTYDRCIADGNIPEAVLFYIDATDAISGVAYAVSLKDSPANAFCNPDTIYVTQGTSADISACDGETNTTAMRYGKIASPVAASIQDKYFIPSVSEMYKLFVARNVVNQTIERCGGDILPIDNVDCWYWTSTECEVATTDRAWRFSLYSGRFESTDKHSAFPVRPILMIRLNKEEQR